MRPFGSAIRPLTATLLWLIALPLLCCGLQAGAQGHVHDWKEHTGPQGIVTVRHLNGQTVSPSNPAKRCEVLEIAWMGGVYDQDRCDAPGHPGSIYATDFHCERVRWRDFSLTGPDVPGKFGFLVDGVFTPVETPELVNGEWRKFGAGGATHYKVGRTHAGSDLDLSIELDDSGTVYEPPIPAYNDQDGSLSWEWWL